VEGRVLLEDFVDEREVLLENLLLNVEVLLENVIAESWCAAIRLSYRLRSQVRRLSCAAKTFLCIKEFLLEGEVPLEDFLAEGEALLGLSCGR
jgi:hypothetical protein